MLKDRDTIVFAGDSTPDAGKLNTPDRLGAGYVKLVRDALFAFRPKENYRVVNAGVSGNTSAQLLARWDEDVAAQKPDVVFCMIGINDVWRHFDSFDPRFEHISEGEYRRNIEAICQKVRGVREFRLMTPFYMERSRTDEMRVMTERYAGRMREAAAVYGVRVLDLQAEFDRYLEGRPGQSISWDRVHPGAVGSMLIARAVLREMECSL